MGRIVQLPAVQPWQGSARTSLPAACKATPALEAYARASAEGLQAGLLVAVFAVVRNVAGDITKILMFGVDTKLRRAAVRQTQDVMKEVLAGSSAIADSLKIINDIAF